VKAVGDGDTITVGGCRNWNLHRGWWGHSTSCVCATLLWRIPILAEPLLTGTHALTLVVGVRVGVVALTLALVGVSAGAEMLADLLPGVPVPVYENSELTLLVANWIPVNLESACGGNRAWTLSTSRFTILALVLSLVLCIALARDWLALMVLIKPVLQLVDQALATQKIQQIEIAKLVLTRQLRSGASAGIISSPSVNATLSSWEVLVTDLTTGASCCLDRVFNILGNLCKCSLAGSFTLVLQYSALLLLDTFSIFDVVLARGTDFVEQTRGGGGRAHIVCITRIG